MEYIKYLDKLTGIHNEAYFNDKYHEYISANKNSKLIMIDFEKFKSINDTFGHNIGDNYLILFAKLLEKNFPNSIVVRLHGDEYCILTNFSEELIKDRFSIIDSEIKEAVSKRQIPRSFGYNAGSAFASPNINETKEQADAMMYAAKKNNQRYKSFSFEVWIKNQDKKDFLTTMDKKISEKGFSYKGRYLFDKQGNQTDIFHISTKSSDGHSIFFDENYDILRSNSKMIEFDKENIRILLPRLVDQDEQYLLSIDNRTILSSDYLIKYLEYIKISLLVDYNNIILAVNLTGLEPNKYVEFISRIKFLKSLGFKICLDKYDSSIGDILFEAIDADCIRFSDKYWKKALTDPKVEHVLRRKVEMFESFNDTNSIFGLVETKEEKDLVESIDANILVSGKTYSKEKQLILK